MDAAHMTFDDASFDTVSISNSLHHMPDITRTLGEMLLVVRPGGCLIVSEMYRDGQTDAQMTHVLLHDWWAAIDARLGTFHRPTFTRAALVSLLEPLHLVDVILDDFADLASDPLEPEEATEVGAIIDRYIERAVSLPDAAGLCRTGEELRRRLHSVGVSGATQLVAIGRKPMFEPEHTRDAP
jgi:SAM-dependent methyltransferase